MAVHKFSKQEALNFGWNGMKSNLKFFILLLIVVGLINFIPDWIAETLKKSNPLMSIAVNLISFAISIIINMGLIKIALSFYDSQKPVIADLFSCASSFLKYLVGSIVYALIILGGFILLIIPGIIWSIKFQFFSYFIVDKGYGPIEGLKKSALITKGAKWDLFLFGLLLLLINIAGVLALFIGLFATIPLTMLSSAFVYRKLLTYIEETKTPEVAVT